MDTPNVNGCSGAKALVHGCQRQDGKRVLNGVARLAKVLQIVMLRPIIEAQLPVHLASLKGGCLVVNDLAL